MKSSFDNVKPARVTTRSTSVLRSMLERKQETKTHGYGTMALKAPANPPASKMRPTSPLFILPSSNVLPAGEGGGASGIALDVVVAVGDDCEAVATKGCSPRSNRRKTKSRIRQGSAL